MEKVEHHSRRYFVSYSGVRLPLKLVNPLEETDTDNRNTYFCGYYDETGRIVACEKQAVTAIYLVLCSRPGKLFDANVYSGITQAMETSGPTRDDTIHLLRLQAEAAIPKPVMKRYKTLLADAPLG